MDSANILLVDDDVRNLESLESVLDDPDYQLVRAVSADEALLALLNREFAVIVLDIHMPGTSGIELAQIIKQRKATQAIPIIFLTAYYQDEKDVLIGYDTGAVDYLSKPVKPEILRSKVAVFVDMYRKSGALARMNAALAAEVTERRRAEDALAQRNIELAKRTEDLSELTAHVQTIAEQERARLARELHDELGSTLTGMSMQMGLLENKVTDPHVLKGLSAIKGLLLEAIQIKQNVINELYPSILDHAGFTAALNWLTNEFRRRSEIEVELLMPEEISINDPFSLAAYRITQECLTNVAKHAEANRVSIEAKVSTGFLELEIRDNGKGLPSNIKTGGHGILGMLERARYLGGSLEFMRGSISGTTVHLHMPLTAIKAAGKKKRVLVVDDHALVRDGLRKAIGETDDFSVEGEASDGKSAIQMGIEGEWDVVILDISLPKVNGMEVLEKIRAVKNNMPIIMLSGHPVEQYGNKAIKSGAACYVEKSATEKLIEEIRRVTRQS